MACVSSVSPEETGVPFLFLLSLTSTPLACGDCEQINVSNGPYGKQTPKLTLAPVPVGAMVGHRIRPPLRLPNVTGK